MHSFTIIYTLEFKEGFFFLFQDNHVYLWFKKASPFNVLDAVFRTPYRYFSIVLKVILSLSDQYEIFTTNRIWIEVCQNVVLSKSP